MIEAACTDYELERRCLSAMVFQSRSLDENAINPDDFGYASHQMIAAGVLSLASGGKEITVHEVESELQRRGQIQRVGGSDAILSLADRIESDLAGLSASVRSWAQCRRIYEASRDVQIACEGGQLEFVQGKLLAIAEEAHSSSRAQLVLHAGEVMERAFRELCDQSGVPIGLSVVDRAVGLLSPGDMAVVGGETSVGKSNLLLTMAHGIQSHGFRVGIVSCEDGIAVFGSRLIAKKTGISSRKLRTGQYGSGDLSRVDQAIVEERKAKLSLAFEIGGTDVDVVRAMTKLVKYHQCDVVMVDYLHTINPSGASQNRKEEVRIIASRIKQAAFRLGVPIVLASQLSRPKDSSAERIPNKYRLEEFGDIENMAELILLIWPDPSDPKLVHGKVEKSKWGGAGAEFTLQRDSNGMLQEIGDSDAAA